MRNTVIIKHRDQVMHIKHKHDVWQMIFKRTTFINHWNKLVTTEFLAIES